jgi:hypothetical protein
MASIVAYSFAGVDPAIFLKGPGKDILVEQIF